jgi:sRNA-binding regulator protein Hfq
MRRKEAALLGKRKVGPTGAFKLFEQEITRLGERLRKSEEQINQLRDLTWVASDLLNDYGGKKVKIHLLDGSSHAGVLEKYDRFNIRIKTDKGKVLVIMKHAVQSLEEA